MAMAGLSSSFMQQHLRTASDVRVTRHMHTVCDALPSADTVTAAANRSLLGLSGACALICLQGS
jgi:hypothetical protein